MKHLIKKLFLALTFIFVVASPVFSQGIPVYDNTNFLSLTKSLLESAKQTSQLLKTVKFLNEQRENINKVSSVIRELKAAQEMARNHTRLFNTVEQELREILSSPYILPHEIGRISDAFEAIMAMAIDDLELIQQIFTSDHLKMSDAERTEMLLSKQQASQEMVVDITRKTERYRDVISFRHMQDLINNRQAVQ